MKWLVSIVMVALCASTSNAYHSGINEATTADANASCNAAFHAGCPEEEHEDHTATAESSGFAAPAGALGGSPLEVALVVAIVAGMLSGRSHRFRS